MIVCDVCNQKVVGQEVEIHVKSLLLQPGLPIKMHLCPGHTAQMAEAVKLVASIFRTQDIQHDDKRRKAWIDRMIPWEFDEKGYRISSERTTER